MKKITYQQLNHFERDRIECLLMRGFKQVEIAQVLKRNPGTISREIKRNCLKRDGNKNKGEYDSSLAQKKAKSKRLYSSYQGKKIDENNKLKAYIVRKLELDWSRMKEDKEPFYASKNVIYRWLYITSGQRYCVHLKSRRYQSKKRRKKIKKSLIPNRNGIEMRPVVDWGFCEGDTVVSGKKTRSKSALVVTYQIKTRFVGIKKISSLKPDNFNKAVLDIKKSQQIVSLTLDNGIENRFHEKIGIPTFFCDPYCSCQKGGVENVNGMIRRYFPKGCDISQFSDEYISKVQNILNNKPRKSLRYKTPKEMMIENGLLL